MLQTKVFEIRDRATFIVAYATRVHPHKLDPVRESEDDYLLRRDGFSPDYPMTLLWRVRGQVVYDPGSWNSATMDEAHRYINDNWDNLSSGDVVDVEFIRGETDKPKVSERFGYPM